MYVRNYNHISLWVFLSGQTLYLRRLLFHFHIISRRGQRQISLCCLSSQTNGVAFIYVGKGCSGTGGGRGVDANCLITLISHTTITHTHTLRSCLLPGGPVLETKGGLTLAQPLIPARGGACLCMNALMSVCGCLGNGATCLLIRPVTRFF